MSPNPASPSLPLSIMKQAAFTILIYDLMGNMHLHAGQIRPLHFVHDLAGLLSGIPSFFLKLDIDVRRLLFSRLATKRSLSTEYGVHDILTDNASACD